MKKITVLLCDDHTVVRAGLRLLLEAAEDIEVVGEVENGRRVVSETKRLLPDVVLLDLSMPLLNGMEAARQIAREVPSAKVLILSAFSEDQYVQHAVEAGVAGYLMKETAGDDLLQAVREIAKGNAYFSPPVARRLLKRSQEMFLNGGPIGTRATLLTSRQTEILQLIAEGYANKQMAGLLSLSMKTVEKHRQELMNKLNLHNTATLTRYAVSIGVVESNRVPQLASDLSPAHPRLSESKQRTGNARINKQKQIVSPETDTLPEDASPLLTATARAAEGKVAQVGKQSTREAAIVLMTQSRKKEQPKTNPLQSQL
jgi:DNA-binding NarL/FixJ family response regulator